MVDKIKMTLSMFAGLLCLLKAMEWKLKLIQNWRSINARKVTLKRIFGTQTLTLNILSNTSSRMKACTALTVQIKKEISLILV